MEVRPRARKHAFTPTGQRVELIVGSDDVLRIPHSIREGDASKQLHKAPINAVRKTCEGVNVEFLHQLFNHGNPDKIRRTLNNAIAQGQLPDTLNIERAITMLHVQMTGMLYTWLLIPDSFDLEAEAEHFVDCYLGSLRECPSLSGQ